MFSIDDRAGNVITTVMIFLIAAAVLYLARGAFFILLLSVLFAYLLEPATTTLAARSEESHLVDSGRGCNPSSGLSGERAVARRLR